MKKANGLLIIPVVIGLSSCNPKISTILSKNYPPSECEQKDASPGQDDKIAYIPDENEAVKVGNGGFAMNSGYSFVFDETKPKPPAAPGNSYKHFRVGFEGGFSYETASINASSFMTQYLRNLKKGCNIGGSLLYYFSESMGCGIKYDRFMTTGKQAKITILLPDGTTATGTLSNDKRISFYGPSFSVRLPDGNRHNMLFLNYSVGYLDYRDHAVAVNPIKIVGGTIGMIVDAGYDISIGKDLSLGFQLSLLSGTLTKYKWEYGSMVQTYNIPENNHFHLDRLDLSIGIRFNR